MFKSRVSSLFILFSLFGVACGPADTTIALDPMPFLVRLDPSSAQAGDTVTIYGSGFSVEEDNIVLLGSEVIVETDWDVADTGVDGEADQISFTVPDTTQSGEVALIVMIGDTTSNSLSFIINP